MFGIGMPELIVILVIALVFFGPQKLPDLARSLGKGLNEFKKAADGFKQSVDEEADAQAERERIAKLAAVEEEKIKAQSEKKEAATEDKQTETADPYAHKS